MKALALLATLAAPAIAQDGLHANPFADHETGFAQAQDEEDVVRSALIRAHMYLAQAQRADGSWEAASDDMSPLRDIGVTALSCLALMEEGHTPDQGPFKQVVRAGLDWLIDQQDEETGLVGARLGHAYLYDHAIATLALAEAHRRTPGAGYGEPAQQAVTLALRARNPYGAWRYDFPPVGDNDTSVTGWMVTALSRAEAAGLKIDAQAFVGALAWFDEVTDPKTGRAGYDAMGSRSSRIAGVNDQYPPERSEGMTAVALYGRLLLGQSRRTPLLEAHADLLLRTLPTWDPEGLGTDMYSWYFGTRAMHVWDLDSFPSRAGPDDAGRPVHEVGVTGLALLALLGDGHGAGDGEHRAAVARALGWLRGEQDAQTGLVGAQVGHAFLYDHAIASVALIEAYRTGRSPLLKRPAQRAVDYITRARNPYGAWRYDVPPVGDNDTSVTTWMVIALRTAESAGLRIDRAAYEGALNWVLEVTDPSTGRVGYDSQGSLSSRIVGINDRFPPERGEAMTGAGLYVRQLLGQDAQDEPDMRAGVQLLLRRLPDWSPGQFGCDLYYWAHGSNAMHLVGGAPRAAWSAALRQTLLPNQRADGDLAGSWDPVDPWSFAGGRVYATALASLALEADYRAPVGSRAEDDR